MFRLSLVPPLLAACLLSSASAQRFQGYDERRAHEQNLMQLSETLGRSHALRVLCNGRDDQYWRSFMSELLELEAPDSGSLRSELIYNFNNAYSSEQRRRRYCNEATVNAEAQYASRGRLLAERMAMRYLPTNRREKNEFDQ